MSETVPSSIPASPVAPPALVVPINGPLEWRRLLHWLRTDGVISDTEARRVARRCIHAESRQNPLVRLANVGIVRAGDGHLLELEDLVQYVARRSGLEYQRIDPLKVDAARVAEIMSANYARHHKVLPLHVTPTELVVATSEPFMRAWVPEIARQARRKVRLVMANPHDIARYTEEFFAVALSVQAVERSGSTSATTSFEQLVELGDLAGRTLDANDQGIIRMVDWLWQFAYDQRASDIHMEPRREQGTVRFRIDGVLHLVYRMPLGVMAAMTARIKLLGRMDVVEKRRPQDGRIKTRGSQGNEVEMRLSTLPTAFGEKLVMRIFDPEHTIKSMAALGFGEHDGQRWSDLVRHPHGIILVTGPTGSGKTTTLYSTLKMLATEEVNVNTIEDPIEMIEPSFNQTQVQPQLNFGFAEGLRSLMRQDPDIIMVGEIRDLPTAEMAVQAALTGHLVFSTLHTNDAPSAISRLMELGIPPYLINASLLGVLAQRLVRTLCPHCKQPDADTPLSQLLDVVQPWSLSGNWQPYRPVGCEHCRMSGFRGRMGLYELLTVSETLRGLIHATPSMDALRRQGVQDGMRPLRLGGALLVAEGLTTLSEVMANTPLLHA